MSDTPKKPVGKTTNTTTTAQTDIKKDAPAAEPNTTTLENESAQIAQSIAEEAESLVQHHLDEKERLEKANAIVKRNCYWALAAGAVPVPVFDAIALSTLQIKMVRELSKLYNVPLKHNLLKSALAALVGGIGPVEMAKGISTSLTKLIPGYGAAISAATMPVAAGATTYAIGQIFTMHFESGGSFLDFNADKVKGLYGDLKEKGAGFVSNMRNQNEAETETPATNPASPVPAGA